MLRLSAFLLLLLAHTLAGATVQGYFGAQLGATEDGQGVAITGVLPGSPASTGGIRVGDVILSVNDEAAKSADQVAAQMRGLGADSHARLVLQRGSQRNTVTLTLAPNPWQNADQPNPGNGHVDVRTVAHQRYADAHPRQHLDLYLPRQTGTAPLLLWIHGGGWSFGDKQNERALALRFAERGVAVAAMNYRLSDGRWASPDAEASDFIHPTHVEDVASAFAWLTKHAEEFGLHPRALFVGGHSAGGHLAALLASDPRYMQAHGLKVQAIAGVVAIGGAYDIPDYHRALIASDPALGKAHIEAVFGTDPAVWQAASPTAYLDRSQVPMLIVVEEQAGFQRYAERMRLAAERAGRSNVVLYQAQARTHSNILLMMSGLHEDVVRKRILTFVRNSAQAQGWEATSPAPDRSAG